MKVEANYSNISIDQFQEKTGLAVYDNGNGVIDESDTFYRQSSHGLVEIPFNVAMTEYRKSISGAALIEKMVGDYNACGTFTAKYNIVPNPHQWIVSDKQDWDFPVTIQAIPHHTDAIKVFMNGKEIIAKCNPDSPKDIDRITFKADYTPQGYPKGTLAIRLDKGNKTPTFLLYHLDYNNGGQFHYRFACEPLMKA